MLAGKPKVKAVGQVQGLATEVIGSYFVNLGKSDIVNQDACTLFGDHTIEVCLDSFFLFLLPIWSQLPLFWKWMGQS